MEPRTPETCIVLQQSNCLFTGPLDEHCPGGEVSKGYCNDNSDCPVQGLHYPCRQNIISKTVNGIPYNGLCCNKITPGARVIGAVGAGIIDTSVVPGRGVIGDPVIGDTAGYPSSRVDQGVTRVDIVGDAGVIGRGTAIIRDIDPLIPETAGGINPVVGPDIRGRILDAVGSGIVGSGSGIVDSALRVSERNNCWR